MVSELICLAILQCVRGHSVSYTTDHPNMRRNWTRDIQDAASDSDIYRYLLSRYDLAEIDAAMRWLELGQYIGRIEFDTPSYELAPRLSRKLTDKGCEAADRNRIPEDEKKLLYQEQDPYAVFVAHQFNRDDSDLVAYLRDRVLIPNGLKLLDGRAEGLEEFRTAILVKIRQARFFLCLLTKRTQLVSGSFASSVWLYQETGVAVAYGKKPLLLVEEGIDSEYVGELQRIYEHITFTRSNHPERFEALNRRILIDLETNNIPLPTRKVP
jgi:hypothetical protein